MAVKHLARLSFPLALVLALSGCAVALRTPRIAEIQHNPARYFDRTVSVSGVVTSAWGVPLLPYGMYKVDDGTGELTVLSQSLRVPTRGSRVRVRGKVEQVGVLAGRALGLHIREDALYVKR